MKTRSHQRNREQSSHLFIPMPLRFITYPLNGTQEADQQNVQSQRARFPPLYFKRHRNASRIHRVPELTPLSIHDRRRDRPDSHDGHQERRASNPRSLIHRAKRWRAITAALTNRTFMAPPLDLCCLARECRSLRSTSSLRAEENVRASSTNRCVLRRLFTPAGCCAAAVHQPHPSVPLTRSPW